MKLKKPKQGSPLWVQLVVTLFFTAMVIAYLGGEYIRVLETPHRLKHAEEMVQGQLAIVAVTTLDAVISQDIPIIETALMGMASVSKAIYRLELIDADDKVLVDWRRPNFSQQAGQAQLINFSQAIQYEGEKFGVLRAGWDASLTLSEVAEEIADVRLNIFMFMFVTATVLLAWMHRLVIGPITRINQRLTQGSSEEQVLPSRWVAREFRVLADSVKSLEEVTISKYELEKEVALRIDAEVALLDARDEAEGANKAKSDFLANMSHELRTPLNAVIGYSEMMEEEARENNHQSYVNDLEKINSAGHHLLVLINEILDLSKIEAGKMELHLEAFELNDLVNSVVTTVDPLMKKNSNVIRLNGVDAIPSMRADVTKVRQILFNLLSNAIKFTEHGEIVVSAKSCPKKNIDGVELLVTDSGIGLNSEDIETLFIPFQQADASTTRKYGGTGLGLSLCRRLCEMMNGEIWVKSQPGQGSTFGVWLPLIVSDDIDEDRFASTAVRKERDPKSVRLSKDVLRRVQVKERRKRIATVLTIDDDPNVLDLMARVFQREGFRPVSATNGKMGITLAHQIKPDLITLDIMMPKMDGWEVLKTLKQDSELCDIPVIMVSMVDNKPMALDVGALDSLTKPIAWDRLLDLTRNVVRKDND